jgi:hypothetical protein
MRLAPLALAALCAAACASLRPLPAVPRARVVTVRLEGAWRADQLAWVDRGLRAWEPAGVRHVRVSGPADVALVYADFASCRFAGIWAVATREALIDVTCLQASGYPGLSAIVSHELGHALGINGHVCREPLEAPDCEPETGVALMNPSILYGVAQPGFDHALGADDVTTEPTALDIAAARRALARRPR